MSGRQRLFFYEADKKQKARKTFNHSIHTRWYESGLFVLAGFIKKYSLR